MEEGTEDDVIFSNLPSTVLVINEDALRAALELGGLEEVLYPAFLQGHPTAYKRSPVWERFLEQNNIPFAIKNWDEV